MPLSLNLPSDSADFKPPVRVKCQFLITGRTTPSTCFNVLIPHLFQTGKTRTCRPRRSQSSSQLECEISLRGASRGS
jgi:hypothetical protein